MPDPKLPERKLLDPTTCPHETFHADVRIDRITDVEPLAFLADLTIRCTECDTPFTFIGMPLGLSYDKPTVSLGLTTAQFPVKPLGQLEHGRGTGLSVHIKGQKP